MLIEKLQKEHPVHWKNATAIRVLTLDAVAAANSGHSGMPMGMADVATVLFFNHLKFDPKTPSWPDRDRLILSAGHGSMLLYSLLYLTGYEDFPIEEIKNFRQLGARTAGHPENFYLKRLRLRPARLVRELLIPLVLQWQRKFKELNLEKMLSIITHMYLPVMAASWRASVKKQLP